MAANNVNDPVSQDKKLPVLLLHEIPESPLQGGKIPLPSTNILQHCKK